MTVLFFRWERVPCPSCRDLSFPERATPRQREREPKPIFGFTKIRVQPPKSPYQGHFPMRLGRGVVAAKRKSSPTVVLAELPERRVFQRGTTTASVPLSGTWVGGTSGIEGRVINADTNAEVAAWSTIVANPTGSTWAGNLTVPQGGWYKIEVRRAGFSASVKTSANRLGVGDIWMLAGQNQQAFMSTLIGSPPAPDALTVYRVSDGTWQAPGTFSGTGGNGGVRFLNLMRTYTGVPQAIINASVADTRISDWDVNDPAMINARSILSSIGTIRGVLWHQGGSDV